MSNIMQVTDIINSFDFEKVHAFMYLNGWKWGVFGKTPNVNDLIATAEDLLLRVAEEYVGEESPIANISTGGFEAIKRYSDERTWFELKFVLEEGFSIDESN